MEYEKIILELLVRVKSLEEKIDKLMSIENRPKEKGPKMSTQQIKEYILSLLKEARQKKQPLVLISGEIHKKLGLKNAISMVCNAMYSCMSEGDEILFKSQSGYSANLKIKYNFICDKPKDITAKTINCKYTENNTDNHKRYIDKEKVWQQIINFEGATFFLQDGGEFTYIVGKDFLALSGCGFNLPKKDIEAALDLYPFKNIIPIQHLRCPSYIFAILKDERIKIYND